MICEYGPDLGVAGQLILVVGNTLLNLKFFLCLFQQSRLYSNQLNYLVLYITLGWQRSQVSLHQNICLISSLSLKNSIISVPPDTEELSAIITLIRFNYSLSFYLIFAMDPRGKLKTKIKFI